MYKEPGLTYCTFCCFMFFHPCVLQDVRLTVSGQGQFKDIPNVNGQCFDDPHTKFTRQILTPVNVEAIVEL